MEIGNSNSDIAMRNLAGVDLNLLVAFEAMVIEENVSRAAARIGVAQPTMSGLLARLRDLFGDEMFVRTSSGMKPTARAAELTEPIKEVLDTIRRSFEASSAFDPGRTERRFFIGAMEHAGFTSVPEIIRALGDAPNVGLSVAPMNWRDALDALEKERIDVAAGTFPALPKSISFQPVKSERMVCIARHNELGPRKLTLEEYLGRGHVTRIDGEMAITDEILASSGYRRAVRFAMQNYFVVGMTVANSPAIATVPSEVATALAAMHALDIHELPFKVPTQEVGLAWCRHRAVDGGLTWLIERMCRAVAKGSLAEPHPSPRPVEEVRSKARVRVDR